MKGLFQIRKEINKNVYIGIASFSFLILLGVWQFLSTSHVIDSIFLPTPISVWQKFVLSFQDGSLAKDMYISFYRIIMGFLIAIAIGIPLGILAGTFSAAEAFIQPVTEFLRYMPVPAFVPLIMVWVGIGEEAKIAVILLGTLFQLIPMVADNVRSVPIDLLNASYTLGAKPFTAITKVLIPAMMPKLMETLRMIMGWAWTYLVVAELVAANSGLGYSILKAQRFIKTDSIFMGILVIGILGLIIDRLFALVNKILFRWAED